MIGDLEYAIIGAIGLCLTVLAISVTVVAVKELFFHKRQ